MGVEAGGGGELVYRVGEAERDINRLWEQKASARDLERVELALNDKAPKDVVLEIRNDLRGLRRTVTGAFVAIFVMVVGSSLLVVVAGGGHP